MNDFSEQALIDVESLKEKALASPDGRVIVSAKTLVQSLDIIVRQQHEIAEAFRAGRIDQEEEDAGIAETRHNAWRLPHPDDAEPGEVCDDISACADIAAAIRANIAKLKDEDTK